MESWPKGAHLTEVRGGGTNKHPQDQDTTHDDNLFSMSGPSVFRFALPKVHTMITNILNRNKMNQNDIDLLIPHQASSRGVKAYSKFGGFEKNKVMDIVEKTGNCVAASTPLALCLAYEKNLIKKGHKIMFVGTGAGLSIASAIVKL